MKTRILVVDDDFMIRELLKLKLSKRGFEVATAGNEKEFWDKTFAAKPDLIILDILLKNKSGADSYRNLVDFIGLDPDIPVIFVTGLLDQRSVSHGPAGANYTVLAKPIDFEDLLNEIDWMLHSRHQKQMAPGSGKIKEMTMVTYDEK